MTNLQPSSVPAQILRRAGALGLYKVAVWALAVVVLLTVLGIIVLAIMGREAPAMLGSLGTTALVGLVAMLRAPDTSE